MLKRRSSRMAFFSSTPSKRTPAPTPKPGRTLVLSSTSSSLDLGNIIEDGFCFDFEKSSHFDNLSAAEPLFNDFFLPPIPSEPPPPPPIPDENLWAITTTPTKVPSLRWSMDTDANEDSEEDEQLLDELCNTPPEEVFTARPITIVYSGKPRMVEVSTSTLSTSARPSLQSDSHSRTSSVSTRDSPLSPSSRFSDTDDKSSPASSISEYSNLVYDVIPEESGLQALLPDDARLKPLKRANRRSAPSAPSTFFLNTFEDCSIKLWDEQPSHDSIITQLDATYGVPPKIPQQFPHFDSDFGLAR